MKICSKCHHEKQIEEFPKRKLSKDGHNSECYECVRKRFNEWVAANKEKVRAYWAKSYKKNPEKFIERSRKYLHTPIGRVNSLKRAKTWQAKNPDKKRVQDAFQTAVQLGKITPWPKCAVPECEGKPEGHHPDYSKPFDVVWLCRKHHIQAHKLTRALRP